MPDVISEDELKVLAAEYVLGSLDHEERKGAAALLEVDPVFRGIVRIWEKRFGELHLMVEAVEPDPKVWERIRPKIRGVEQLPPAIPSAPLELAPSAIPADSSSAESSPPLAGDGAAMEPTPAAAGAEAEAELKLAELAALLPVAAEPPGSQASPPPPTPPPDELPARPAEQIPRGFVPPPPMIHRSGSAAAVRQRGGRGWMAAAMAMSLVAVVLAGLISAWRFFPERLPAQLKAYTVLNLPAPLPPAPPPPAPPPPFAE